MREAIDDEHFPGPQRYPDNRDNEFLFFAEKSGDESRFLGPEEFLWNAPGAMGFLFQRNRITNIS
tara:strand:- start:4 stop:198 length:195 start_codon:yes stop_codon:yes gene_type:complete